MSFAGALKSLCLRKGITKIEDYHWNNRIKNYEHQKDKVGITGAGE